MLCKKCGQKLDHNSNVCGSCGTKNSLCDCHGYKGISSSNENLKKSEDIDEITAEMDKASYAPTSTQVASQQPGVSMQPTGMVQQPGAHQQPGVSTQPAGMSQQPSMPSAGMHQQPVQNNVEPQTQKSKKPGVLLAIIALQIVVLILLICIIKNKNKNDKKDNKTTEEISTITDATGTDPAEEIGPGMDGGLDNFGGGDKEDDKDEKEDGHGLDFNLDIDTDKDDVTEIGFEVKF